MKARYLLLFLFVACSSAPIKDFKTIQWLPDDGNCHARKLKDGSIVSECYYDEGTDEEADWVVVRKSDFNKELNYQDLLIKSCKKWKK
jgi:hypothetical protein